ncbi:MAG: hypothetical protein EXR47_03160 [Dehalococcoidia bacterium]|nr:hypothetical protein [Dehalococcoidia bacterium]
MNGLHLLVQGYLEHRLEPAEVTRVLRDLPQLIGMTIVSGPHVFDHSGIVVIAESHISIHWLGDACWVDVFSCKEFDPTVATRFIQERLHFRHVVETRVITRGPVDVRTPALV